MNRLLSRLFLMVVISLGFSSLVAEEIDVTKFLGIPVDGYKPEMIKKLKAKGFVYSEILDRFEGEFNGCDVYLYIATNNNKIYRIIVCDRYDSSASNIKYRFNKLCKQFEKNKNYLHIWDSQSIPKDENISYEMKMRDKKYDATYFQLPDAFDDEMIKENTLEHFKSLYPGLTQDNITAPIAKEMFEYACEHYYDKQPIKMVWFRIGEKDGKYRLVMYYDNIYNQADGEDL